MAQSRKKNIQSIFADVIFTGKSVQEKSYLVFDGPHITGLSKTKKGKLLGKYPVITPAFIDAHSHIGMARAGEPAKEMEANEQMDPFLLLGDALDSIHMDDGGLKDAVEMGVLYSCVVPGSGNIIGGRSAVIRNYGQTSSDALVARAGLKAAFGYNPMAVQDWKGVRPTTRMGAVALLREKLYTVHQKIVDKKSVKGKKKEIAFSAEEKILQALLTGRERLRAHVHKTDDIALLLRLSDEFKLKITVEHAMDVHSPRIFRELKKKNVPVIYGPLDSFPYKVELRHYSWRNIRHLLESQVTYGLMSDHPITQASHLLLTTRWFLRAGLSKQQALEIITRKNAEILGIDTFLGTLTRGKWASFVCWNGDPYDLASHPVAVYGEGNLLYPLKKTAH
jgi:imidazolonepropionase-like amidohydrolase